MKKIKQYIKLPSEALRAMVDGLTEQSKRPDFEIDMGSFGEWSDLDGKPVCFGCAATCTIQKITGHNFGLDEIGDREDRAKALKDSEEDLHDFEHAMDSARNGYLSKLFEYFGYRCPEDFVGVEYDLKNYNWQGQLSLVEDVILRLQEEGY